MQLDPEYIEAEVYHADMSKDRYYVKITFIGVGMYINSFVVQPSKYEDQPYWVQPPKHPQGFKQWVNTVDFEKNSELWQIIQQKAREAVDGYVGDPSITSSSKKVMGNTELNLDNNKIDLDEVPF